MKPKKKEKKCTKYSSPWPARTESLKLEHKRVREEDSKERRTSFYPSVRKIFGNTGSRG